MGRRPAVHNPVFVLTHEAREPPVKQGGTTFTFVNDGIERALELAKSAAETEQIELEGTRAIDSRDVTHLQFRPPKTPRKDGGAP